MGKKRSNFHRTKLLSVILLCSFSILLVLLSLAFYRQYREYSMAEERMEKIYNQARTSHDDLNKLLSLIAQSENTFRLYTVDFDSTAFMQYAQAIDSVQTYIDSLAMLPIEQNPFGNTAADIAYRNLRANEYTSIKKTVEQLVAHTRDSLNMITTYLLPTKVSIADSPAPTFNRETVPQETVIVKQDTIVRKRPSLLRRIFSARDDTIVVDVSTTRIAPPPDPATAAHATTLVTTQQADMAALRRSYSRLQAKERELVNANYTLLSNVRAGIEKIRMIKMDADRSTERQDFDRYRASNEVHTKQLVLLLCLMLIMVAMLWYYIRRIAKNEAELENERQHVERLAEEKSTILAGISHEIRTPLSSLLGTVKLIRNERELYQTPEGEVRKKIMDSSYHNLLAINDTITDILNLSRLESGTTEASQAPFAPADTLRTMLAFHQQAVESKRLELHKEIEIAPSQTIIGNEFRVKQIASNLVGNAIKYTSKGHVLFRAEIVRGTTTSRLRITVKDTGMGIPAAQLNHIFRKYYTVAEPDNSSGYGLGLYITKLLADELGAKIRVSSVVGKGTTFVVSIPIPDSESSPATAEHAVLDLSALPQGLRLLVVDDNPVNILYMQQFLAGQPHLETTTRPEHALDMLEKQPFDVVLTDINMPKMNGWQLLHAIKSSEKHAQVKVVAISADPVEITLQNGAKYTNYTFDGMISKPFTEADFAQLVLQALGR